MIDVGLIGFGLAGRCFHAPVIQAVPGLRLAAILQRRGDEAAKTYPHTPVVRSLEQLLAMDSIRLVVIATPNQSHFPLAKQCLEAKRDVVVDKPFTTTLQESLELCRLASREGHLLTVYHERRFDADFQALRRVISNGDLGRVVRFESYYDRFRPLPKPGAWREQPGSGSGVFFDLAPHLIDHALTLFGHPMAVTADLRIEREGFTTDDAFDLYLQYQGGLRVHLGATMLGITPRARFVVFGTNGSFVKRDFDPLENSLRSGSIPEDGSSWNLEKEENWGDLTLAEDGPMRQRKIPSTGDWREFYANVRDAILGKAPLEVTPQQAVDVMAALELGLESQQKRCTVPWRNNTL